MPEYKLKIFVDALQALFNQEPIASFAEDDLAASAEDWLLYDESGDDIAADLMKIHQENSKARRAASRKKYAQSERGRITKAAWGKSDKGKAAKAAWNTSDAGKAAKAAWNTSDAGKAARNAWKKTDNGKASKAAWYETEAGQACTQRELAAQRAKTLDHYLNRRFVASIVKAAAPCI